MKMDHQNVNPTCLGQLCIPCQQHTGPKAGNKGRNPEGRAAEEELEMKFEKWIRVGEIRLGEAYGEERQQLKRNEDRLSTVCTGESEWQRAVH